MPTPTTGELKQTYLHFFINNSQRYCGLPGIFHAKIDNGIWDAIKSTVQDSDIPAAERGETDKRLYGVELTDGKSPTAFYKVVRDKTTQFDYAYGPGVFFLIENPDHYHFLWSAEFIALPHGAAPVIERNLLEFAQREAQRAAPVGVTVGQIVG